MQQLTSEQKAKIKKEDDRRRCKRRQRENEYRSQIERLRRRIAEARRRRQRMLLMLLLAILTMQESIFAAFRRSYIYSPKPTYDPTNWTPDPSNDFAPRLGHDDHCDGYSRERWSRMIAERGIKLSREVERLEAWKSDPDYDLFPPRYREWNHKPYIGQVMEELTAPYWQQDALTALKLLSPPETHKYLDEACLTDLREAEDQNRANFSDRRISLLIAAIDATLPYAWQRKSFERQNVRRQVARQTALTTHVGMECSGRDGSSPSRRPGNLEAWRTFGGDRLKDANVVVATHYRLNPSP